LDLPASTAVEAYVVESVVGRGAMATVYRVRHAELGTVHALKLLTLRGREVHQRLLREGRVQGALRHPNVVAVTDLVRFKDAPGLVMELVDGPPLDRVLAAGALTRDQIDGVARGVLEGMAAAHRAGLVHRDLKPANVVIATEGGQLVPKVTDFGLAKALADHDTTLTRSGTLMGTPAYVSPEQISDPASVEARADLWSIGALLYELVTGRRAFPDTDVLLILHRIRLGDYVAPREVVADLPARWCRAIEAALVVDRDLRVGSCQELLTLWLDERPEDRPVPPPALVPLPQAAPKSIATSRLWVAALVALAAAAGAALAWWPR
jgi:serine/threonine-protein kinase